MLDTTERNFPRSPRKGSTICASASASRSATPPSRGATRRRATTSATTRTASATTIRCGAIPNTPRKTKLWRHHRAAELPVRDQPHHVRLRRRPARHPRDVVGRRLDLAQAGQPQRRDLDRGIAEGPRRAPDALRRPRHPADLPRRFLQPARRPGRRGRQLVLPHRARPRARAGHQVQGGARRARRAATPTQELAEAYKLYAEEEIRGAAHALLGGRRPKARRCRRWSRAR